MIITHKSKGEFDEKWEGPFIVDTVYSNGAYSLITQDGDRYLNPINGKFLKPQENGCAHNNAALLFKGNGGC